MKSYRGNFWLIL